MTKEEYLEITNRHWESINSLKDKETFYDTESSLDEIMVFLGRDILEKSLGDVPSNRRKKKKRNPIRTHRNS